MIVVDCVLSEKRTKPHARGCSHVQMSFVVLLLSLTCPRTVLMALPMRKRSGTAGVSYRTRCKLRNCPRGTTRDSFQLSINR